MRGGPVCRRPAVRWDSSRYILDRGCSTAGQGEEGREQVLGRDKSRQGNIAVFLFLEEGIKLSGMNHKLTNPEEWLD